MSMIFLQPAEKVIKEEKQPLSADEIWQIAQDKGYDKEVSTKGKTPGATLGARLYVEVRDNPESIFVAISSRPKRFVLRSLVDALGIKILEVQPVPTSKKREYFEKGLHPFMVYYGCEDSPTKTSTKLVFLPGGQEHSGIFLTRPLVLWTPSYRNPMKRLPTRSC